MRFFNATASNGLGFFTQTASRGTDVNIGKAFVAPLRWLIASHCSRSNSESNRYAAIRSWYSLGSEFLRAKGNPTGHPFSEDCYRKSVIAAAADC
jgi:hypothetical protein